MQAHGHWIKCKHTITDITVHTSISGLGTEVPLGSKTQELQVTTHQTLLCYCCCALLHKQEGWTVEISSHLFFQHDQKCWMAEAKIVRWFMRVWIGRTVFCTVCREKQKTQKVTFEHCARKLQLIYAHSMILFGLCLPLCMKWCSFTGVLRPLHRTVIDGLTSCKLGWTHSVGTVDTFLIFLWSGHTSISNSETSPCLHPCDFLEFLWAPLTSEAFI